MTVEKTIFYKEYECKGQKNFVFSFPIVEGKQLDVFYKNAGKIEKKLVYGKDYEVISTLKEPPSWEKGGTISLKIEPYTKGQIFAIRNTVPIQTSDFVGSGLLPPKQIEETFDKLTMSTQEAIEEVSRAIRVPISEHDAITILPSRNERINRLLGFDEHGNMDVHTQVHFTWKGDYKTGTHYTIHDILRDERTWDIYISLKDFISTNIPDDIKNGNIDVMMVNYSGNAKWIDDVPVDLEGMHDQDIIHYDLKAKKLVPTGQAGTVKSVLKIAPDGEGDVSFTADVIKEGEHHFFLSDDRLKKMDVIRRINEELVENQQAIVMLEVRVEGMELDLKAIITKVEELTEYVDEVQRLIDYLTEMAITNRENIDKLLLEYERLDGLVKNLSAEVVALNQRVNTVEQKADDNEQHILDHERRIIIAEGEIDENIQNIETNRLAIVDNKNQIDLNVKDIKDNHDKIVDHEGRIKGNTTKIEKVEEDVDILDKEIILVADRVSNNEDKIDDHEHRIKENEKDIKDCARTSEPVTEGFLAIFGESKHITDGYMAVNKKDQHKDKPCLVLTNPKTKMLSKDFIPMQEFATAQYFLNDPEWFNHWVREDYEKPRVHDVAVVQIDDEELDFWFCIKNYEKETIDPADLDKYWIEYPMRLGIMEINGHSEAFVHLRTDDIPEGDKNQYFTNDRVASNPTVKQNKNDIATNKKQIGINTGNITNNEKAIGAVRKIANDNKTKVEAVEKTVEEHTGQITTNTANIKTNKDNIEVLDKKVDGFDGRIKKNHDDIVELDTKVDKFDSRITKVEGDVKDLDTQVTKVKGRLDTVEPKVTKNTTDIASNLKRINEIDDDYKKLQPQVVQNTSDIKDNKTAIGAIQKNVGEVVKDVTKNKQDITAHNTRITDLEQTVGDSKKGLVKLVNDNIASIKSHGSTLATHTKQIATKAEKAYVDDNFIKKGQIGGSVVETDEGTGFYREAVNYKKGARCIDPKSMHEYTSIQDKNHNHPLSDKKWWELTSRYNNDAIIATHTESKNNPHGVTASQLNDYGTQWNKYFGGFNINGKHKQGDAEDANNIIENSIYNLAGSNIKNLPTKGWVFLHTFRHSSANIWIKQIAYAMQEDKVWQRLFDTKNWSDWKEIGGGEGSTLPCGTVIAYGADVADNVIEQNGAITCNGQPISRAKYSDLFGVIGTTYGKGNGKTTFNVPNFNNEGAFLRGLGGNSENIGTKQGDAIRNITGIYRPSAGYGAVWKDGVATGAFQRGVKIPQSVGRVDSGDCYNLNLDVSKIVPTAEENRPINYSVKYAIVFTTNKSVLPNKSPVTSVDGGTGDVSLYGNANIKKMIEEGKPYIIDDDEKETKNEPFEAIQDFDIYLYAKHTPDDKNYVLGLRINDEDVGQAVGSSDRNYGKLVTLSNAIKKGDIYEWNTENFDDSDVNIRHKKFKKGTVHKLSNKTVYLVSENHNIYAGKYTIPKFPASIPVRYKEIIPLEEKEGYCQVWDGEKWEYKTDPLPEHRELCDWIEENIGFEGGYVVNEEKYKEWQREELSKEYLPKINALESACSKAFFLDDTEKLEQYKTVLKQLQEEFDNKLKAVNDGEEIEVPSSYKILCPICESLLTISEEGKEFCLKCGWKEKDNKRRKYETI